ncbi:PREDICTED: apoptosis-associated speck-like protein containing a CARD [Nanorana parkeri]|uniref:apoptosis-associated speck-like protein containing a CARD n=1 Tax=Nanorana parkeri TaxID=125878 RepID=UPI0008540B3C|nr:PREDICTED: apoptosis-associated speck-like protein containing a CARD [Nanorana parkeri]
MISSGKVRGKNATTWHRSWKAQAVSDHRAEQIPQKTYQGWDFPGEVYVYEEFIIFAEVNSFSWRKKPKAEPQSTSEASSSSAPKPKGVPFVDKHREALVNRCALVDPILDGLLSKELLTTEENDTIRGERPAQNQMRKLFQFIRAWSDSDKQAFYLILKEKNPRLIEDLEQS